MSSAALEVPVLSAHLEADRRVVRAAALLLLDAALALAEGDPHEWGIEPCKTCRAITQMVARPYGCVRVALETGRRKRPVEDPA